MGGEKGEGDKGGGGIGGGAKTVSESQTLRSILRYAQNSVLSDGEFAPKINIGNPNFNQSN